MESSELIVACWTCRLHMYAIASDLAGDKLNTASGAYAYCDLHQLSFITVFHLRHHRHGAVEFGILRPRR